MATISVVAICVFWPSCSIGSILFAVNFCELGSGLAADCKPWAVRLEVCSCLAEDGRSGMRFSSSQRSLALPLAEARSSSKWGASSTSKRLFRDKLE
jgi:hypothetical protein